MLESSIMSQYFLEEYKETDISITSSINQYGILASDDNGNYLNSGLIGTQTVYKCSTFSGIISGRYVMFHNSDNEILGMIKGTYDKQTSDYANIRNNFYIKNQDVILYKINVGIESEEFSGSTVTFGDFTTDDIFQVVLNGEITTEYTRASNVLTFNSGMANSYGNQAFVIYYPRSQSLLGVSISMQYYSPYQHEVTENDKLLLGYQLSGTVTVSDGSNTITTSSNLTSVLSEYDYIRVGLEVKQILQIDASSIKTNTIFENSYSGEDIYILPYVLFANIENPKESPTSQYYEFQTRGIKLPVEIKQSVSNTFSFNYFIDTSMKISECGVYRYASDDFNDHVPLNNKMRLVRAYYENDEIDKFVYLTNCRKLDDSTYNKSSYDTYDASLKFEDKLTLVMNKDWNTSDDILGAGGAGNFKFIRS
jgi:hypothetical protein